MKVKEFEYVKNLWNEAKGSPDIHFTLLPKDQEEKMILESLLQRGVIKRLKGSYHVCLATKSIRLRGPIRKEKPRKSRF